MAGSEESAKLVLCKNRDGISIQKLSENAYIGTEGDIPLATPLAAERHGQFVKTEDGFEYRDLGTKIGTYWNGVKLGSENLAGSHICQLKDGDVLRIDDRQFGTSHEEAMVMIFRERFEPKVEWKIMDLSKTNQKYYISCRDESVNSSEITEGAAELPRHYAILSHEDLGWRVTDHNTTYGVYVNGNKIKGNSLLYNLDVIRIGKTMFLLNEDKLLYNHTEARGNNLVIHIEERSVWNLFRKHVLLQDIGLTIHPGEMVLILGGSGAGKTTFINAVMGYEKAKGTIKEGDIDIYKNYNQMKYQIGFVPQQDLLRMEDIVKETLENAAEMKLPTRVTSEEKAARVEEVLTLFGLEKEKESLVGKLSGGQRKRLSIAIEYISNPSLFFLDEPDSGLDGVMSRSLMKQLRTIADDDKIVLVITHAPDRAADLFDKVIVLAKGAQDNIGHLAFYGLISEAYDFFDTDSLEGIVKRINQIDEGGEGRADEFIEKYKKLEENE